MTRLLNIFRPGRSPATPPPEKTDAQLVRWDSINTDERWRLYESGALEFSHVDADGEIWYRRIATAPVWPASTSARRASASATAVSSA